MLNIKRSSIQRNTRKEISGSIHGSIYHQQGNIYQCGQTITANFNKNSPGYEFQLSSKIQRISGGIESKRSKTSRGGWRQEVEQKKY